MRVWADDGAPPKEKTRWETLKRFYLAFSESAAGRSGEGRLPNGEIDGIMFIYIC